MNSQFVIRSEANADVEAITALTVAAFQTMAISNHTEQFIITALRAAKALTISLVAEIADSGLLGQPTGHLAGRVVGHVAFSPVAISDGTPDWYALGPIAVSPEYQRQGIGKALIKEGLARLKELKAQGCCLVGHPDYYRKFGFINMPGLVYEGIPQEVFFALPFNEQIPQGSVVFHEGFQADGNQKDR